MEENVLVVEQEKKALKANRYLSIIAFLCIGIIIILCVSISLVWLNIKANSRFVEFDKSYVCNETFDYKTWPSDKIKSLTHVEYVNNYFYSILNNIEMFNSAAKIKNISDASCFFIYDYNIEEYQVNKRVENYTLALSVHNQKEDYIKELSLNYNIVRNNNIDLDDVIKPDMIEEFKNKCIEKSSKKDIDFSNFAMKDKSIAFYIKDTNDYFEISYNNISEYLRNGLFTRDNVENYDAVFEGSINPYEPMIALTFDDGPYGPNTSRILKVLTENDAKATFFTVGYMVDQYPDTLNDIINQGSEIGNHTKEHLNLNKYNYNTVYSEIMYVKNRVREITGKDPVLLRPPYGNYNETVSSIAGGPIVLWNVDTLDWKTKNSEMVKQHILDHVSDGDIILMHDIHDSTVEATEMVVPILKDMGYQMVTVSELLEYKQMDVKAGQAIRCAN